jgi:hypothetical protein
VRSGKKLGSRVSEPDYRLYAPAQGLRQPEDSPVRALCLVYPWGRSLDGKDDQRDNETPEENPGAVVVSLLEKGEAAWAMMTNGKLWRFYSQRTHSRATNYYEIDPEEVLAHAGPQAAHAVESFRYFWLFFRCQAVEPLEIEREGKTVLLTWLDQLLLESADYAEFEKPTVRYQVIATYQQLAFTTKPYLSNGNTWIIPSNDLTLIAILNSKVAWWFLDLIASKLEGGAFELRFEKATCLGGTCRGHPCHIR